MMTREHSVLLLGGTGRTGRRVLEQLLERDIDVRAIARSAGRLPTGVGRHPGLTVVEADPLSLTDEDLRRHLRGCHAVVSCLGHVTNLKGILGPPRDLVTRAVGRLCQEIVALQPTEPVKLILMSSVSVNDPAGLDLRRGTFEKAFLWAIRSLIPPAKDNQRAVDLLHGEFGPTHPFVQWTAVRPDTLLEGDICDHTLHESLVNSLFAPGRTNMANVAHFMCDLVEDPEVWDRWKGKLPVIVNAVHPGSRSDEEAIS